MGRYHICRCPVSSRYLDIIRYNINLSNTAMYIMSICTFICRLYISLHLFLCFIMLQCGILEPGVTATCITHGLFIFTCTYVYTPYFLISIIVYAYICKRILMRTCIYVLLYYPIII